MIDPTWDSVFVERLSRHYDELKWYYSELYHNDTHAFDYFCSMLYDYYCQRSPELKEWDRQRTGSGEWYKGNDLLGMLMYVNCFADTLKGISSHIDYIEECGVNYLHLMPLLKTPLGRSDGGYAVEDFRTVQPELGTMEDLKTLASTCHARGISVCLDFVMNHTSEDHEWAVRARKGEKEYQDRYFFYDDWTIPNEFEKTVPQVFPTTAPGNFTWCEEAKKVVMTSFYPYQWDLNYANPTVFNDMTANMLYLCNNGVDIIRLDAVPYIWKELGTNCRNLPQVHTLVRMMRMAAEVVCPSALLLGEVVMEPSKVVPYFGSVEKPECHLLYNVTTMASTWHTVATRDVRLLRHQLDSVFSLPNEYTFLNYLRCHDDIGWGLDYEFLKQFGIEEAAHKKYLNDYLTGHWWGSDSRGQLYNNDERLKDARLCGTTASLCGIEAAEYERNGWKENHAITLDLMLHAFLLIQSGIPVLYSGDEIGQLNDYSYEKDPLKQEDSRYLHRGRLDWNQVALRGDRNERQGRIFQGIQDMEAIRRAYSVFDSAADCWTLETWNNHVLGIGRYYKGEKVIALFNFSEQEQTAWIDEPENYHDLFTGEARSARGVVLPGHDFVWLYYNYSSSDKVPVPVAELRKPAVPEEMKAEPAAKADSKKASAAVETDEEKKPATSKKASATAEAAAEKKPAARKKAAAKAAEGAEEKKPATRKKASAAKAAEGAEEKKPAARKKASAAKAAEGAEKKPTARRKKAAAQPAAENSDAKKE